MLGINKKDVVRYAVLPGIRPRMQELIASGFNYIPFFVALVYQAVRLLPAHHPYADSRNMGRFGLRHVIAEAANNLVMSRKNIDQIVLFFTILFGLAIIFVQVSLLGFSAFIQPVMAATMPDNFAGFFLTSPQNAQQDLAFIMMDLVFGVEGIFNSCVALSNVDCILDPDVNQTNDAGNAITIISDGVDPWVGAGLSWPFPIHHALHQMFQMYSVGLLVVAAFITLYFIVTIVAETAQTGTAFGKRFNKVWAPIRLVVAFGLLVPLGQGLNSSQYVVLYAAKYGSGFASNGWAIFNSELQDTYLGEQKTLVTRPNAPDVTTLLQFLYTASVCYELERVVNNRYIIPYLVGDPLAVTDYLSLDDYISYEKMLDFANGAKQVTLRFGHHSESDYATKKGHIDPVCGEVTIHLVDPREVDAEPAAEIMQRYYWYIIDELWYSILVGKGLDNYPEIPKINYPLSVVCALEPNAKDTTDCEGALDLPNDSYRDKLKAFYQGDLNALMGNPGVPGDTTGPADKGLAGIVGSSKGIVEMQAESDKWTNSLKTLHKKGWAGAGIWYNKVAELNGTISAVVNSPPSISLWPKVMEYVLWEKSKHAQVMDLRALYEPVLPEGKHFNFNPEGDKDFADVYWVAFRYWQNTLEPTSNALIDTIQTLLGVEGLYSIRKNPDVHPLAQIVGVGRAFINSAMGNLADTAALSLLGAGIGGSDGISAIVGLIMTIVMISLTIGFVLFYVVPFLPFIYFFFAVGGWIKGIFEAMVGAPLWALAHIRIDGEGLAGKDAVSGYFLIFEIFLRPILIVFGLLASISIFSALVAVMNQTWDVVIANLGGFDSKAESEGVGGALVNMMRGPVDQFFFTAIYTIIIYLMAMSSFKLIDLIPNNILRWMGSSVSTFNDQAADPAQGLVGTATIGAQQTLSSVGGGAKGALQGIAKGS